MSTSNLGNSHILDRKYVNIPDASLAITTETHPATIRVFAELKFNLAICTIETTALAIFYHSHHQEFTFWVF